MDAAAMLFLQTGNLVKVEDAPASMERMHRRSSLDTFVLSLEECRKTKDLTRAKRVHMDIKDSGLEAHSLVANPLVQLYAQCGSLPDAQQAFDRLLEPDEPSWTSLIVGYVKAGKYNQAFDLFDRMQVVAIEPRKHAYAALIKACSSRQWLDKGRRLHDDVVKNGFETENMIGNTLVDMYGKCNSVVEARDVFDELLDKSVVSWNALISGYADHGLAEEAFSCLEQMQSKGLVPDEVTFLCSLKACASIGAVQTGQRLHAEVAKEGFEHHLFLASSLIDMYAKRGFLVEAQEVLNELPSCCVVAWTALLGGYVEHGQPKKALECLAEIQRQGMSPTVVTFMSGLKACSALQALEKGQELHVEIITEGFEDHPIVNSNLVDMYAKSGRLVEAREVFDERSHQDIVSWTTLIAAYADNGHDKEALRCLDAMQQLGISPNVITIVCSLKACCNIGDIDRGRKLHTDIMIEQLEGNYFAINSLVCMYAKCGFLGEALELFEELRSPDVISWNAIIMGCVEQEENERALALYTQMLEQGLLPDNTTFVCMLKAVGNMETFEYGMKLHAQVFNFNQDQLTDVVFATALIDMYCKCGRMSRAQQVFDSSIATKDRILWTALLTGYAQQGSSNLVFQVYDNMRMGGLQPNAITFLSLLNVCSHSGLVDTAYEILQTMKNKYGIEPGIKHLNCVVDLLGRSGHFVQAVAVLEKLPVQPCYVIWSTLLCHCRNHSCAELAKYVFECALSDRELESAVFVVMSNMSGDFLPEDYEEDVN
ncbi:hypothetical protein GOP47_0015095 [Adiantum capillus-veneris]|uniref:Pentatricopeptide repeat-containing protein n=1 Tax=Adiantum capillus-veneris TaxID=13818 RepID=A0A9D4UNL2_ADICA|nr:hypothetical protein GOP47_0015095 [Adiantum capillus-veneris]